MYHINRMCVLFWFRKSTTNNQLLTDIKKVPTSNDTSQDDPQGFIQMRVTYNAERSEFGSTHIECKKSQWDTESQTFKGKSIWAQEQNKKLNTIKQRIEKLTENLERENEEITVFLIKHAFCNKKRSRGGEAASAERRTILDMVLKIRTRNFFNFVYHEP
ncbi:hypothetical protein, partial [Spirosoma litoris]